MTSLNESFIDNRLALAVIKAKSVYMNIGYISWTIILWWDVMRRSMQTGHSFSNNLSSQAVLPPSTNRVMPWQLIVTGSILSTYAEVLIYRRRVSLCVSSAGVMHSLKSFSVITLSSEWVCSSQVISKQTLCSALDMFFHIFGVLENPLCARRWSFGVVTASKGRQWVY